MTAPLSPEELAASAASAEGRRRRARLPLSRGAPKPTHGVRVKLDFVVFYDEPQDWIPLGQEHVDAMVKAIVASLRDSGAASVSPTNAGLTLDQRFTVAALAKRMKTVKP